MSLSNSSILKYGSLDQLKVLRGLGNAASGINVNKLKNSYDASIFEGDFNNFKNSDLSKVFNQSELKQVFKLLDKNGDKKLSSNELAQLSKLGGSKGSADKVDKNDLKVLLNNAESYVDKAKNANKATQDKVTTKTGKNGTKTVTKVKPDGTKVVTKYNKNGKKTSSVKTDANGDKTTTKFKYVCGHLVDSKSKKTRVVDGKKVTVSTSETRYNKDGKKAKKVTKDASGNIISATKYSYGKNGKLDKTSTIKADGTRILTDYDTTTGKKVSKIKANADGKITSRVDYDSKTGNKKSKSVYEYDENGKKVSTSNYTYNAKGQLATREKFDANKNPISKSTYYYNKDGSMLRTDRDPKTGEVMGTSEFKYDGNGRKTSKTDRDAAGNIKSETNYKYYSSDIQKSSEKVTYNDDGSYSKKINNYDKDGNLTSVTNAQYDKDGKQVSSKTEKIPVKETKIDDLPKIDYKALEKAFGGDGKALVDFAKKFMGFNEANGSYKKFTGGRTEAWCADFVTYVVKNFAASQDKKLAGGFGSASVSGLMSWAQNHGCFKNTSNMSNSQKLDYLQNKLKPGDVIIWKSNGASHTGIVKSINADGTFTTVEGNSSDQVKSNKKSIYDSRLTGFIPYSSIVS